MKFEDMIKSREIQVEECDIRRIADMGQALFLKEEKARILTYHEFVLTQLAMVKKRWWVLQMVLLSMLWYFLYSEYDAAYIQRSMGIGAALFVILLIPELWKNVTNRCLEIEMSAYYSLHQVYAARMMLFGIVDIVLLTVFGSTAYLVLDVSVQELIVQFFLPMTVTACICFATLARRELSAGTAFIVCAVWSSVWWLFTMKEDGYFLMVYPLWIAVFVAVFLFMLIMIYRVLHDCEKDWEVRWNETGIE